MLIFFPQKPSCAMCLIFLKKSLDVLIQPSEFTLNFLAKAIILAKLGLWCAYFFRQKPSYAICLIFSKKSLHVLNWPCAYKKISVVSKYQFTIKTAEKNFNQPFNIVFFWNLTRFIKFTFSFSTTCYGIIITTLRYIEKSKVI